MEYVTVSLFLPKNNQFLVLHFIHLFQKKRMKLTIINPYRWFEVKIFVSQILQGLGVTKDRMGAGKFPKA